LLEELKEKIELNQTYEEFIKLDWKFSVLKKYKLDTSILDLATDTDLMLSYLKPCYELIVKPMTDSIKKTMVNFQIVSEGEFFSCDLRCRINYSHVGLGQRAQNFADPGASNNDAESNLKTIKKVLTNCFSSVFHNLVTKNEDDLDS